MCAGDKSLVADFIATTAVLARERCFRVRPLACSACRSYLHPVCWVELELCRSVVLAFGLHVSWPTLTAAG